MANKPPGADAGTYQLTHEDIEALTHGPVLKPLPKPNWTSNGTYGRVKACYVDGRDPPGTTYLTQGPTREELARQAEEREHLENVFAMEEDPLWWVAESARAFGATEHQVSVLHKLTTKVGEGLGEIADRGKE